MGGGGGEPRSPGLRRAYDGGRRVLLGRSQYPWSPSRAWPGGRCNVGEVASITVISGTATLVSADHDRATSCWSRQRTSMLAPFAGLGGSRWHECSSPT